MGNVAGYVYVTGHDPTPAWGLLQGYRGWAHQGGSWGVYAVSLLPRLAAVQDHPTGCVYSRGEGAEHLCMGTTQQLMTPEIHWEGQEPSVVVIFK